MDLRLGDYREVLADVVCHCLLADPPYGAKTHAGHDSNIGSHSNADKASQRPLSYDSWTPQDVADFVAFWAPRTRGWMACMTSHDLGLVWQAAYEAAGLYAFAPVSIIQDRVRLGGDGPCSCTVYLMVARPRNRKFATWVGRDRERCHRLPRRGEPQLRVSRQVPHDGDRGFPAHSALPTSIVSTSAVSRTWSAQAAARAPTWVTSVARSPP